MESQVGQQSVRRVSGELGRSTVCQEGGLLRILSSNSYWLLRRLQLLTFWFLLRRLFVLVLSLSLVGSLLLLLVREMNGTQQNKWEQ